MFTYTLNGNEVHPRGEWEIEYRRNVGQIFWRRHLVGELTFQNEDYTLIMSFADCTVLTFIIYCMGEIYWTGEFNMPYDFKIDEDQCNIKGTPEVVDEYSCIMNNYETEYVLTIALFAIAPILQTCVGGFLRNLPNSYALGKFPGVGNNYYLFELINGAGTMNCGLTLQSSFMWRDNFPNGDNYAVAYGINNYITGATNRLEYIYLLRNTSLRNNLGGSICDGNDYFTFKDFETFLRNAFNAYWYIDQNGDFRMEHISFFLPGFAHSNFGTAGYDLTSIISDTGRSYAYRRDKYRFLTDQLFDQERWTWQHYEGTEGTIVHGQDFEGTPVFYGALLGDKSDCVPGEFKTKEWNNPYFWSDIYWAHQLQAAGEGDTIACPKGYCMLDITGGTTIRCETGALSGVNTINGHLSTANLQDWYHRWDRIFLNGNMNNGSVLVFDSAIKKRLQESIKFPYCCTDDFYEIDYITTHMGLGAPYSLKLNKNSITTELLYD